MKLRGIEISFEVPIEVPPVIHGQLEAMLEERLRSGEWLVKITGHAGGVSPTHLGRDLGEDKASLGFADDQKRVDVVTKFLRDFGGDLRDWVEQSPNDAAQEARELLAKLTETEAPSFSDGFSAGLIAARKFVRGRAEVARGGTGVVGSTIDQWAEEILNLKEPKS